MADSPPRARIGRLPRRGEGPWSPGQRATFIACVVIVMGSLYVATYSLALGDPVPHKIDAALVGDRAAHARTVAEVEAVARHSLAFKQYPSAPAALHAIDLQRVYTALELTSKRPTLYVASAAGASVARVLERITTVDPTIRVVDTHPLAPSDPSGVDIFYLMLVTTIIGFTTVLQVIAHTARFSWRHWIAFVVGLASAASLVLSLVDGPLLGRLDLPVGETWGILALQLLSVSSFTSLMSALIGRWAVVPTWLFFVILGNSSSGGAVAPPLLPRAFAFVSQWLPSGASVTALRDAVYFGDYQHVRPIAVLVAWAAGLFACMVWAHRRAGRAAPALATSSS
jgi:hypothetical protein